MSGLYRQKPCPNGTGGLAFGGVVGMALNSFFCLARCAFDGRRRASVDMLGNAAQPAAANSEGAMRLVPLRGRGQAIASEGFNLCANPERLWEARPCCNLPVRFNGNVENRGPLFIGAKLF